MHLMTGDDGENEYSNDELTKHVLNIVIFQTVHLIEYQRIVHIDVVIIYVASQRTVARI